MTGTAETSDPEAPALGVPECPYVGLVPFTEGEADFFFGRRDEARLIAANLRTSRLTILYAGSGVGKTSTLRAGLLPRLRRIADQADAAAEDFDEPVAAGWSAVYVSEWAGDATVTVTSALAEAAGRRRAAPTPGVEDGVRVPDLTVPTLREVLRASGAGGIHLVLDQFEEYLLYHPQDDADLSGALGSILRTRDLPVNVLLCIREDTLAGLDRFKGAVPRLFDNYLRLAHLTPQAARTAVEAPLDRYNALVGEHQRVGAEPALLDELLDDVRVGRVGVADPAGDGAGAVGGPVDSGDIEAPFLQLVLTRLWAAERDAGSSVLRRDTLRSLGGARTIVRNHLDTVMRGLSASERDLAAAVFRHLVTASGTKIALSVDDLADLVERPTAEVLALLESLAAGNRRILRTVPPPAGAGPTRYEIFHDVLAGAVLDWRRRHQEQAARSVSERRLTAERDEAEQRAREARRQLVRTRLVVLVVGVALLLAAAGGFYAWNEARTARQQAALATARERAERDPQASLQAAVAAWRARADPESVSAVLRAASVPRGRIVEGPGSSGEDQGRVERMASAGGPVATVGFGGEVRVLGDGQRVAGRGRLPGMAASNPFPDVSPDGDRIALVDDQGRAGLLTVSSGAAVDLGRLGPDARVRLIAGPAADRVLVSQPGIGTYTRRIDGQGAPALLTPTTGAAEPVGDVVVTDDGDGVLRARDPVTGQQRGPALPMGGTAQYLLPYGPTQVLAVVRRSTGDAAVQVWDLRTGVTPGPHALPAGPTIVWNVRVDPLRRSVALAVDKRAFVYDVDTGAMPFATPEQTDWVDDAAPSPDGRWLATSGADGRVLIWPRLHAVVPGQPTYRFLGHAGAVERVEWDATSRGLVSAGTFDGTVRHWALPADLHFDGHRSWVVDLDLSADGRHLVTGSPDDTAQVIAVDAPTAPPLVTLTPGAHVAAARFVPADPSSVVLLTDYGDAPELWRWTGGAPSRGVPFEPLPGRYLTSIDVSPDGRTVVGGDDLGELHLWDTGTGRLRGVPPALFTATTPDPGRIGGGVAFDPRGELIASANGREILVWRRDASGAFTPERSLPLPSVVDVVFNPSGDVIAGGTQDGHIMVWHRDGRPALDRPLSAEGSQRLGRFSVSADARRVGAGDASGLVQVWDVATGELLTSGRHHGDAVNDVVFLAPDGSRLASASDDQTVAIWDCDACRDPRAALAAAERAADAPGGEPDR